MQKTYRRNTAHNPAISGSPFEVYVAKNDGDAPDDELFILRASLPEDIASADEITVTIEAG